MAETNRCPACSAELAPDAPRGLCPECLLKQGFRSADDVRLDASPAGPGPTTPYSLSRRFVPPKPSDLAPYFPHLEIIDLIGQGGMGAVYKARQRHLNRNVALKILPPEVAEDPSFHERFIREAQSLAQLNHPQIVTVHDFGETRGLYWFLMEYVDGTNLRRLIADQRLEPRQALSIVPQICDALQVAHDEGVVHRDIKPENILIDRKGRVKIADFGLAKLLRPTETHSPAPNSADLFDQTGAAWPERLTGTGQIMGTPHYMAPEQMERPLSVDHRADIYSLGVVFYEMLTGELPLGRFPPPSRKVAVDTRLDDVVLRSLEKEPQRRYQRASEVKTDVEHISRTEHVAPLGVPTRHGSSDDKNDWHSAQDRVRAPAIVLLLVGIIQCIVTVLVLLGAAIFVTMPMEFKSSPPAEVRSIAPSESHEHDMSSIERVTSPMPENGT